MDKTTSSEVRVTTDSVMLSIVSLPSEEWTTFELAAAMNVPEYPVRAAVSWLLTRKVLEVSGTRNGFYWNSHRRRTAKYQSNTYRLKGQGKVDFHTLNMAFVYGR